MCILSLWVKIFCLGMLVVLLMRMMVEFLFVVCSRSFVVEGCLEVLMSRVVL